MTIVVEYNDGDGSKNRSNLMKKVALPITPSWYGIALALLALCERNPPVIGDR